MGLPLIRKLALIFGATSRGVYDAPLPPPPFRGCSQVLTSCVTFALLKNESVKCALVAGTQETKAEKLS